MMLLVNKDLESFLHESKFTRKKIATHLDFIKDKKNEKIAFIICKFQENFNYLNIKWDTQYKIFLKIAKCFNETTKIIKNLVENPYNSRFVVCNEILKIFVLNFTKKTYRNHNEIFLFSNLKSKIFTDQRMKAVTNLLINYKIIKKDDCRNKQYPFFVKSCFIYLKMQIEVWIFIITKIAKYDKLEDLINIYFDETIYIF